MGGDLLIYVPEDGVEEGGHVREEELVGGDLLIYVPEDRVEEGGHVREDELVRGNRAAVLAPQLDVHHQPQFKEPGQHTRQPKRGVDLYGLHDPPPPSLYGLY